MVLKKYDLGHSAVNRPVVSNPLLQLFKKNVTWICILHQHRPIPESLPDLHRCIIGTHDPIYQSGMGMNYIGVAYQVVQGGLHRGSQVLRGDDSLFHHGFYLFLTQDFILAKGKRFDEGKFFSGEGNKSIFSYACQWNPTGFYPDGIAVFIGSVPATCNNKIVIIPIIA